MKTRISLYLLVVLLAGCSSNEAIYDYSDALPIGFNAYIEENGKVRPPSSTTRAQVGELADGYKLIGILSNGDYNPSGGTGHIGNIGAKKIFWETQTTKEGVYSDGARFWISDINTRHSFYAYSANPAGTTTGYGVTGLYGIDNTSASPQIDFHQLDNPAEQIDLLVATPVLNLRTSFATPMVNFYFRHSLSRIVLKLMGSGGVSLLDCNATVTYSVDVTATIKIDLSQAKAVAGSGYRFAKDPQILKSNFILPSSAITNDNALLLGDLILLPQTNLPEGFIKVILTYYIKAPTDGGTQQTVSISLPATNLLSETQYVYLLNIIEETQDLTISSVTLEAWKAESKMVDTLN